MEWTLAHPLHDVDDIVELADSIYGVEADAILTRDRGIFRKNVTIAATVQLFDKGREFLAVCRNEQDYEKVVVDGFVDHICKEPKLLGYCWFDRGGYTTYAHEEISNAKFHHVDLGLSPRMRVKLINQMIDQHILWASTWGIPVICSTSIRGEHDGFMKIHQKRGFVVNGSYAWGKTAELVKGIK